LDIYYAALGDAGMAHLKPLDHLLSLSVMGVPITDVGLAHLQEMEQLQNVHLETVSVTLKGLEGFRRARPGVHLLHW
jgi:hypothetical protein